MNQSTWAKLERMFRENPVMMATPVARPEIDQAEAALGVRFPSDYVDFVHRYGGALVGRFPVIGLRQAPAMGNEQSSIVEITNRFRNERWLGLEGRAVISVDHSGNPILVDEKGVIWMSDHDAGEVVQIASTFEEFLLRECLQAEGGK